MLSWRFKKSILFKSSYRIRLKLILEIDGVVVTATFNATELWRVFEDSRAVVKWVTKPQIVEIILAEQIAYIDIKREV